MQSIDVGLATKVTEFWSRVDQRESDGCWPWTGYREDGYGRFFIGGRMRWAHELAVTFSTGETKGDGLDTCHSCDNPPCCNPAHLRFDTRLSNVRDMDSRGRRRVVSKLSPEMVRVIRERRESGARQKDLAAQYGVTDGLISQIVRGLRWPDAPGPIETERKYLRGE